MPGLINVETYNINCNPERYVQEHVARSFQTGDLRFLTSILPAHTIKYSQAELTRPDSRKPRSAAVLNKY